MALNDYEVQYVSEVGTLLMNDAATPGVDIMRLEGIHGMNVKFGSRTQAREAGDIPGAEYAQRKDVTLRLEVRGDASLQAYWDKVAAVENVFTEHRSPSDTYQLSWKFPGEVEQFIRARPWRRRRMRQANTEWGITPIQVMLRSEDPRRYAVGQVLNQGTTSFSATNNGNAKAYPELTFVGQTGTGVLLNNTTNGSAFATDPGGSSGNLIANMDFFIRGVGNANGHMIYIGNSHQYEWWKQPRSPFYLSPGVNSLVVGGLGGSSNIQVRHYHTWI